MVSSIEPGGQQGRRGDAARLQPDTSDTYDWAETPEERAQAEKIDRLAGDRDLIKELRTHGFAGPEWERAAGELVRYGMTVITSWTLQGTIYQKRADRGRPIERAPVETVSKDEASSIAGEVITVALARFRDEVLANGLWDPAKGASLTTFFIGQCLLRFPTIWRPWLTTVRNIQEGAHLAVLDRSNGSNAIEDDVVMSQISVEGLRAVRSEEARKAMVLVAYGYTTRRSPSVWARR